MEPGQTYTPPPPPGGPTTEALPWEDRARVGFLKGLMETVKLFVVSPGAAFARTREMGDFGSPLLFAVLLFWVGIIVSQLWSFFFGSSLVMFLPEEMREEAAVWMAGSVVNMVFWIIIGPIFAIAGLFILSGILHLCLMIVGGLEHSRAGFEGTIRAVSYASVAQLANLLPFFGGLIAIVWAIVLEVIGLAALHKTTQGKAIVAVLIPLALCCVCTVLGIIAFGAMIAAGISGMAD